MYWAVRSQFRTPSVPFPKETFQLSVRSVPVVEGGGADGELTFIWIVVLAVAPPLSVTVKRAVKVPADWYVVAGFTNVEVVPLPKSQK